MHHPWDHLVFDTYESTRRELGVSLQPLKPPRRLAMKVTGMAAPNTRANATGTNAANVCQGSPAEARMRTTSMGPGKGVIQLVSVVSCEFVSAAKLRILVQKPG